MQLRFSLSFWQSTAWSALLALRRGPPPLLNFFSQYWVGVVCHFSIRNYLGTLIMSIAIPCAFMSPWCRYSRGHVLGSMRCDLACAFMGFGGVQHSSYLRWSWSSMVLVPFCCCFCCQLRASSVHRRLHFHRAQGLCLLPYVRGLGFSCDWGRPWATMWHNIWGLQVPSIPPSVVCV